MHFIIGDDAMVIACRVDFTDESDQTCLPATALSFWAFSSLYNVCLLLQLISALFHSFLLCGKQFDRHIKIAICVCENYSITFSLFISGYMSDYSYGIF